ncbi:MAG TPA: class I SAM-dependent methyltransferase [Saprospiraceae bacterium]|nr:class I SAM-dependent methyltransferase [Saprospiraceae bacterium]HPI07958.1 class I SAM-dependent methyltransferase [Saprospiraceae bacterium]
MHQLMRHCQIFYLFIVLSVLLPACRQESAGQPDSPNSMLRQPAPSSRGADPTPLPKTGAGSFENLVADYESKDRGIWQKPNMVISLLGDLEGKTVADIGAGTGYFTFRMVPSAKKVIGIDIDQRFINFMDSVKVRLDDRYRDRFETRLAKPTDPLLKPEEVDAVVLVNTYGYIGNRVQYLKTLWKGITPGGRLLIIDFKKNNLPVGPPDEYKVALSQVQRELLTSGFSIDKIDQAALDYQYIILAEKPLKPQKNSTQ